MKQKYTIKTIFVMACMATAINTQAQGTEVFETEATGASTFSEGGKTFTVTNGPGETYDIYDLAGAGWNGTAPDNKFLDNSSGIGAFNDGSSFTINSSDASTFAVRQLYLFCSTNALANHSGTLTIEGKVGPTTIFTITKSAGFSNVATFSPNNGFTLIDFATEGAADYSDTAINQLVISSTGNLDYMALDAFQWAAPTLSVGTVNANNGPVKLYPNPATTYVKIKNLRGTTSYTIFDVLGKAVQKGTLHQDEAIFINKLNVGLYMVKLDSGQSFKLIKN
jgi:hypothetical protein